MAFDIDLYCIEVFLIEYVKLFLMVGFMDTTIYQWHVYAYARNYNLAVFVFSINFSS